MPRNARDRSTDIAARPGPELSDWNLLRSFIAVFETGTLTEAARRLGTTQPSVGRHLRELESLVGEALFVRRPGRLVPTRRASDLSATVLAMKHAVSDAERLFTGAPDQVVGTVRVAASEVYAFHVIAPMLAPLLAEQPELEVELAVSNHVDNLLRRDADIAVRFVRPEQDDVIAVHVGTTELGLFVHADYVKRFGEPSGFELPEGAFVAGFDRDTTPLGPLLKGAPPATPVRFRLRTDAILSRQAAVETGYAIAAYFVDIAAQRPTLRRVLPDRFGARQDVWLCAHAELRRSAAMRFVWSRLEQGPKAHLSKWAATTGG